MRFPKALSDAYQTYSSNLKSGKALPAAAICLAMFNCGLFLDYRFAPDLIWQLVAIRLFATTIPILLTVWCAGRMSNHGLRDWVVAMGLIWGGIMLNVVVGMRGATATHLSFAVGLYLIVVNIVFHLKPKVAAVLSGAVCLTTFFFLLPRITTLNDQTILAITFVVAATLITLLANFRHDATMRQLYLLILREQFRTQDMEQANRELSTISHTDALTGIANRRSFDLEFELACKSAGEQHKMVALLLIDVDHFKHYNDSYGHPTGDACLRQVAVKITEQIRRDKDIPARIGGEEFAIILRDLNPEAASLVAARIHTAMSAEWPQGVPAVTVSIGLAIMPASSASTVMQAADKALYEAKQRGRSRTITTTALAA